MDRNTLIYDINVYVNNEYVLCKESSKYIMFVNILLI